ncbi:DNA mismatch repair protein MutS [compost metagenome]
MRKLIPGAAGSSYGIYCARLAGLPHSIIERANTLLEGLEQSTVEVAVGDEADRGAFRQPKTSVDMNIVETSNQGERADYDRKDEIREASGVVQLSIFGEEELQPKKKESSAPINPSVTQIIESVKNLDLMNMTPLQAMQLLHELSVKVKGI